jgi:hypothetical protein
VDVPEGVTEIAPSCFEFCPVVAEVNLPHGVNQIKSRAFFGCHIREILIPSSVVEIADLCFAHCPELTEIFFTKASALVSIGRSAFTDCAYLLAIDFPASLSRIGDSAFLGCTRLASVKFRLGTRLELLGQKAFAGTALTHLVLPATVGSIAASAFPLRLCDIKVEPTPAATLWTEDGILFHETESIVLVRVFAATGVPLSREPDRLPNDATETSRRRDDRAIWISARVGGIAESAFECSKSNTVLFEGGSGLVEIGANAFARSALATIVLPRALTVIRKEAFAQCATLTEVLFEKGCRLATIEEGAFVQSALHRVILPGTVAHIEKGAFRECGELKEVLFEDGESRLEIGEEAFALSGLISVILPGKVAAVGVAAFPDDCAVTFCDEESCPAATEWRRARGSGKPRLPFARPIPKEGA